MPTAKSNSTDYKPIPAGVQHAVCYGAIDIGTPPPMGNFPPRRKVLILWELPNEKMPVAAKDGSAIEMPRVISKEYTLSTDKKSNLRKDLNAWRGKDFTEEEAKSFDVSKLIGANCQLQVVHKKSADGTKTYANVGGIMALAKGAPKIAPEAKTIVYDIPEQGPIEIPSDIPEWIANKIKASDEYQERISGGQQHGRGAAPAPASEGGDEDVPF